MPEISRVCQKTVSPGWYKKQKKEEDKMAPIENLNFPPKRVFYLYID
jgi:hypothetical protein